MTKTQNSEKIWQEIKAKVRAEELRDVHAYMYNNEYGHRGTTREAKADRKRQLNGIDRRAASAEAQIRGEVSSGKYEIEYPQGFIELVYSGIVQVTPNTFMGPPIEPSFSHIAYPMGVFERLQERLNGREFVFGYTEDTQDARFQGKKIDLTRPADPYVLRSMGVFSREILKYFPIDETLKALGEVKERIGNNCKMFGKTENQGQKMLEEYLNHEVFLPIWIAENHGLSKGKFKKIRGVTRDIRDLKSIESVNLALYIRKQGSKKTAYLTKRYGGNFNLDEIARMEDGGKIVV